MSSFVLCIAVAFVMGMCAHRVISAIVGRRRSDCVPECPVEDGNSAAKTMDGCRLRVIDSMFFYLASNDEDAVQSLTVSPLQDLNPHDLA